MNEDFTEEMEKILYNITETDQYILQYLLDDALWQFYQRNYDEKYKLPYVRD